LPGEALGPSFGFDLLPAFRCGLCWRHDHDVRATRPL